MRHFGDITKINGAELPPVDIVTGGSPVNYCVGQMTLDDYEENEEYSVRRINYHEAIPYVLNIHYARRIPNIVFAFGLFHKSDCVGCVTYGIPASPCLCKGIAGIDHKQEVLELNRLVIVPGHEGKNLASMLIGRSLKMIPGNHYIVSYADAGAWGHIGYVYQATNWMYTGMTKRRTDIAGDGGANAHARHYKKGDTNRIVRSEKHRYVYIVAESKKQRKKMLKDLKYKPLPYYPKGDSRHYDTENPKGLI